MTVPVSGVEAVGAGGAAALRHEGAVGGRDPEGRAVEGLVGELVTLLNDEGALGVIVEGEGVGAAAVHGDGLRGLVQDVPVGGLGLPDHIGAGLQAGQGNHAGLVGGVVAVGTHQAAGGVGHLTVGVGDVEGGTGQVLARGAVLLDDVQSVLRGVIEGQGLGIAHGQAHGLRGSVHLIASGSLDFRHHVGVGVQAADDDLAVGVRLILAVGADGAVVADDGGTAGVRDLEDSALEGFLRHGITLLDDDGALGGIVEGQGLGVAVEQLHRLGGGVHLIAQRSLNLSDDVGVLFQAGDDDLALGVGGVAAVAADGVVGAHHSRAVRGRDLEDSALQGVAGDAVALLDDQGPLGGVVERQGLRVAAVHLHRLGGGVHLVALRCLHLSDDVGVRLQVRDDDLAAGVGGVEPVGAHRPARVVHDGPGGGRDPEGRVRQRLMGHAVALLDDEGTLGGILNDDGLGIAVGPDDHVGHGAVDDVPVRGLDFRDDIGPGLQVGDVDLAVGVGGKDTVLRQRAIADNAVQAHLTASGCGQAELSAGEGLTRHAVALLDDELALGLVGKGQGDRFASLDDDGLGLGVDDKAVRSLRFRDDYALAGLQVVDEDFTIGVRGVDAVALPDEGAVGVRHFELSARQRHAGVDGADLLDEQVAVRGVVEFHGDDVLVLAGDVHRLGGGDDVVAVGRLDFLYDVGASLKLGPDDGAVGAGGLLADDCAAGAAGAAQVAQLEGTAGDGVAVHAVLLEDDDGGQRRVLKGEGLHIVARQVDALGRGVLDLVAVRGLKLRDLIPAGLQAVSVRLAQVDLAVLVAPVDAQVLQGTGCGAVPRVPDLELRALHGAAHDAVLLVDGQLRGPLVLQTQGVVCLAVAAGPFLQEHVMGRGVQDVAAGDEGLGHGVPASVQVGDEDFAVLVGSEGADIGAVLHLDVELDALDAVAFLIHLLDEQAGPLLVEELQGGGLIGLQRHGLGDVVEDVVAGHTDFRYLVGTGLQVLDEDFAVVVRGGFLGVTAVDFLNQEGDAGDGCPSQLILLDDSQARLRGVLKGQLAAGPGVQDDALAIVGVQNIRGRDRQLCDLVGAGLQASQGIGAITASGDSVLIAYIHATDLKNSAGNPSFGAGVELFDSQSRTLEVLGSGNDGLIALDVCFVNINANRVCEFCVSLRSLFFCEGIEALRDIVDSDGACSICCLASNQLAILVNIEDGISQRSVILAHLLKLDADFGVVLEHELNIALAVPVESLLAVRVHQVAFR